MGIDVGDRNLAFALLDCKTNTTQARWFDLNVDEEGCVLEYEEKNVIYIMQRVIEENYDWFSKAQMIGVEVNRFPRQKVIGYCLRGILTGKGHIVRAVDPRSVRGKLRGFGHSGPKGYKERKKASLSVPLLEDRDLETLREISNQVDGTERLNKNKGEKTDMIEAILVAAYVRKNYKFLLNNPVKRKRKIEKNTKRKEKKFIKVKVEYKTRQSAGPFVVNANV